MTQDQLDAIANEIKYSMYYLSFPESISTTSWKDGAGQLIMFDAMGLDHLQASIRLVEKDIARLRSSLRDEEVISTLEPLAQGVLASLRRAFERKIRT